MKLKYIMLSIGIFFIHVVGCLLGTSIWEIMNVVGHETVSIKFNEVMEVKRGKEWARNALWLRIPFYILAMNFLSPRDIISFETSNESTGDNFVYALMFNEDHESIEFEKLLIVSTSR